MNIEQVKNIIANYEYDTAREIGKSVQELRDMRRTVKEATSQRVIIISRHRKRIFSDDRMTELLLRHASEVLALKREITGKIEAFDREPEVAVLQHIAERLGVDIPFAHGIVNGCRAMDDYEKELWRVYRHDQR